MSDPTSPTAPDAAAPDVLAAIERKALSLLAGTTPGRIDVHRCDADSGAIDYQLQRAPGTPATVLGYATDSDGSSRAKADATLWAHAHEMTTAVLSLAAEVRRLTADLARLRAPADLAAIGARAAAAKHAAREHRFCRDCGAVDPAEESHEFHVGCPRPNAFTGGMHAVATTHGIVAHGTVIALIDDVPTLLALLAAEREGRAAEVAGARTEGARAVTAERDMWQAQIETTTNDAAEAQEMTDDLLRPILRAHPLPWHVEQDWTHEVTAADGAIVAKCMYHSRAAAIVALAEKIHAEQSAPDCYTCGQAATCFGGSEGDPPVHHCDDCCGHGNEDGHCEPVAALATKGAPDV